MKHVFRIILGFSLLLLLCDCDNKKQAENFIKLSDLSPVNINTDSDYVAEIKDWLLIGPFGVNPLIADPAKSFHNEDLKKYGITENFIDDDAIDKLHKKRVNLFLLNSSSPQIKLFRYVSKMETASNFYLVSKIYSDKNREATLIMDGSNSYAVWLNKNKLIEVRGKYNTNKTGDRFVNVSLREGYNTLFVKVNKGTNKRSWDFICAVASRQEAERIYRVNYSGDYLVNPVFDNNIEVYTGPYTNGRIEVINNKEEIIVSDTFEEQNTNCQYILIPCLDGAEEGFYKTALTVDGKRIEEILYKGDFNKYIRNIKEIVAGIDDGSQYCEDLKTALQRLEYLNHKQIDPNSSSEIRFINRNKVFWGYSLSLMLRKDALTQLMTYKDKDGNSGVFIFHNANKQLQNIPLVIIIPSALESNLMIEDWYTSNLDQIEADNAIADQYGMAVAWIYAGGKNYSSAKTEKEITAVIDRLLSEYAIDEHRIFITGDCEGGRRALVQLAATPKRYAGCAVSAPLALLGEGDGIPVNLLPKMGNIPIMIRHGIDDDMSPVEYSRKFYEESQKLNMSVEYIEVEGSHVNVSKDLRKYFFEFFNRIN